MEQENTRLEAVRRFRIGQRVITLVARAYLEEKFWISSGPLPHWKITIGMAIRCPKDKHNDSELAYQIASGRTRKNSLDVIGCSIKPSIEQLHSNLKEWEIKIRTNPFYVPYLAQQKHKHEMQMIKANRAMSELERRTLNEWGLTKKASGDYEYHSTEKEIFNAMQGGNEGR